MEPLLYGELVPWYRLLDPPEDHAAEAASYRAALERTVSGRAETLLELGAGAGHNALHLKARFRSTLTDLSEPMLGLARELNPECAFALGDMRTLRLGQLFDAVLVHDAVMYMRTEVELLAAAQTAFVHTRPGGAAIFVPDCVLETFHEATELHEANQGGRALRCMSWSWDPDPGDTTFVTEYAFLLRDRTDVRAVHDRHVEGLFPRAAWLEALSTAGYRVEVAPSDLGDGQVGEMFVCRRP